MKQTDLPISILQREREKRIARFLRGDRTDFVQDHAQLLDDYFRTSFATSEVGPRMRMDKNPYSIIALGGYGRKELCIHSDVDVLLLFKKTIPPETKGLIQETFYPLWDMGLEISYVTRSVKECLSLASRDFEVLTSLLDGRFLCGISSVYSEAMDRLRSKILRKEKGAYTAWLAQENKSRHARFGDSAHLLEPHLKEGHGGLRDYHAMLWAGKAVYDMSEPRDLEFQGHLSHEEFETLSEALDFVTTVRNWLHHLTGRKCDQLYFEYQVKVARALGFRQKDGQQGVERFLGALHGRMAFLKRQHLAFLTKAVCSGKRGRKKGSRRVLVPGIHLVSEALDFESPEAVLENPHLLIGIFERSAILGYPLTQGASRLVKELLYLVDEEFRQAPAVIKSLERILAGPARIHSVLDEMMGTGLMGVLIPEVKGVINRIQYDEYHVYPVDKHSLHTVEILKEWEGADPLSEEKVYANLYKEIEDPRLLLWAALFHDIGKAEPEHDHHPETGAEMVTQIFKRMGFPPEEIATVSFLVRHHLLLVHTATRRDINDEKVVVQCARKFPDIAHLKMLYLLTVADSRATGPKAWNDWNRALLKELFSKVLHVLKTGELATPAIEDMVQEKKKAVFESATNLPETELEALFDHLPPRYLLYTPSQAIVRHLDLYHRLGQGPFVLEVEDDGQEAYRTVTLCAKDFPGLFSLVAGVFTLNNIDILSAQVYTWRNHTALDVFQVKSPPDPLREKETWTRVKADLKAALLGKLPLAEALRKKEKAYQSQERKVSDRSDRVVIDNHSSDFFTIIEVYTYNSLGLLYGITTALFRHRLDIWVAKIATKVDQVVDVFYVRDFDGQKVNDQAEVAVIKEAIKEALSPEGQENERGASQAGPFLPRAAL
jgi:[protein-PII] uridylyltransferase